MRKIIKLEPAVPALPKRKKVAAYARVSMESEKLMHSLSAQISYFSELIQKNPEWEYAGVYADRFISGTSIEKRAEFQRLVADCEAGKINIVLCKSISRFARNTVDLLKTVRHLKELGVEVRFEKENISSMSNDGEMLLTLLASFAEQESISQSENIKWTIKKKYEKGESYGKRRCLGYKWENGHYVIIPEEAEIVREIFALFLAGKHGVQIADELNSRGIKGIKGHPINPCYVVSILDNITYTGDLRFQEHYSPAVRHMKKNYGEVPKYVLEDAHEPIISREDFAKVKAIRDKTRMYKGRKRTSCFSRKMFCGCCGTPMQRMTARLAHSKRKYWECRLKITSHGDGCQSLHIYEDVLEPLIAGVLDMEYFQADIFDKTIRYVNIYDTHIELVKYDDEVILCQR